MRHRLRLILEAERELAEIDARHLDAPLLFPRRGFQRATMALRIAGISFSKSSGDSAPDSHSMYYLGMKILDE